MPRPRDNLDSVNRRVFREARIVSSQAVSSLWFTSHSTGDAMQSEIMTAPSSKPQRGAVLIRNMKHFVTRGA